MDCSRSIRRESIIADLAEFFKSFDEVEVAAVFGSLARNEPQARDVDVAVKFSERSDLLSLGFLVSQMAKALGVSEDCIDIIDLDYANPALLFKVLTEGVIVKGGGEALRPLAEKASLYPDALVELRLWGTLDPDPKLDAVIVTSRVEEIRRNARFLRDRILCKRPDELDYGEVLALERAVHRIIEAMLDICRHMTSVYSLGLAESYGEYPRRLAQAGLMPKELAEELLRLAGLRNILVHRYLETDTEKLYAAAKHIAEKTAVEFIKWIQKFTANPPESTGTTRG